ncbi:aminotransferase class III-fold pyridoxal phosphate-dependent enzyme [Nostoc sp. ChiQUE01b]|uniref:aminotransferase class III-fold pyridoxal phosphate-dependent enzyme n=1 Tax=Nostoc sp. ChiQUE01b TaxID=3075376 RepID=UPI002AD532E5|nr:aminotransferase class III-fold pyridoxal phosphate-dependent enzyme [Nostoc sp. ChiQUE01b]MDZ8257274.1 aminotransferase class III-fold pyridoxal phosphate-dependent enzyme [Nostoc sp. ChiQUE01b]
MNQPNAFDSLDEIAIVGMAGRFPKAKNIEQFWQNLRDGVESISFFSDEELLSSGIDPATLSQPQYVKAGSVLEDIEFFDAAFFDFSAKEAQITDPQQRLFLECAWEALEGAGYDSEIYAGRIGVYAGVSLNTYFLSKLYTQPKIIESVGSYRMSIGNSPDFLPTHISYKLNFKGPSINVQTACSTSLVAVHLACQSLLNGESDIALAGGVSIQVPHKTGYRYQQGGIMSPDGHCRAFDAKAQGTISGNGVGIVVLKRLEDALADKDCIHAVIKGSAINNDGSLKVGFTAPSVDGQAKVIAEALAMARVESETISYVETHGTGTVLGDPIEIAALTQAFRPTDQKNFCAIASVKTNIGHLDAAAGVAGLIKTVLALKHQQIPPSLHFQQPNPQIDFANSPFYVNHKLSEWKSNGTPRRAGVSSFGIGGTNAHVIVEEAPMGGQGGQGEQGGQGRKYQLLVVSAKTSSALDTATTNLVQYLKQHPNINLADVAYTLGVGRRGFSDRRILVCQNLNDAVTVLETPVSERIFTKFTEPSGQQIAFMFPGQGAQYVDMGRELYETETIFRKQVDYCCEFLKSYLKLDLRTLLYPHQQTEAATQQLQQTHITQSAVFVVEYALAQLWMAWGIRPWAMIGHSIGEYVAACIAGVFSLEDALVLVANRGQLMQQLPSGTMIAVSLPEQKIQPMLGEKLSLAAINAPGMCVVSGLEEAVNDLQNRLTEQGVDYRRLHTSHAFHSPMMDSILLPFQEQVSKISLNSPKIPFVSNVTGTWITPAQATDPKYWAKHLRQTVRFSEGIAELLQQPKRILLEVGPGRTLSTLANKQKAVQQVVLSSVRHPQQQQSDVAFLLNTLGRLWLEGINVDWSEFYAHEERHRIPLPTYPFERKRYWIEPILANDDNPSPKKEIPVSQPEGVIINSIKAPNTQIVNQKDEKPIANTAIEQIISQHLQVMSKLVDLLPKGSLPREVLPSLEAIQPLHPDGQIAQTSINGSALSVNQSTSTKADSEQQIKDRKIAPTPKVASQQIEKESMMLSPRQQKHLDALIARFVKRTQESKRLTQAYRSCHANSRAVSGFFPFIKEMIYPIHAERGEGARLWDVDGNEYVDISMGFGTLLFGHSPSFAIAAIQEQSKQGILHGPQSRLAGQLAELICELTSAERTAFCNDGTEAVMGAVRIARSVTGRSKIALFAGSYHGGSDGVLVKGVTTNDGTLHSVPMTSGIPSYLAEDVMVLEYGTPESLNILKDHAHNLAAILVEPIQSSRPDLQPKEFLFQLRQLTQETGTVLIFDEVVTGFRMHPGGIQALWGIQADITTYGKAVAAGIPIGVVAGKAVFMDALDGGMWNYGDESYPQVKTTFFAGTFFKHPLVMAVAWAVLNHIKNSGSKLQEELNQRTTQLVEILNSYFEQEQVPIQVVNFGSLFRFYCQTQLSNLLFYHLLEKGIYVWEGRTLYLSTAHTDEDIEQVIWAVKESVVEMQAGGFFPSEQISTNGGQLMSNQTASSFNLATKSLAVTANANADELFETLLEQMPDALGNTYAASRKKVEQAIGNIWQELFGFNKVNIHDNFFELGGDSLTALQAISLLNKKLEIEIPIESIYEAPTINSLANIICPEQNEMLSAKQSISRGQRRRNKIIHR